MQYARPRMDCRGSVPDGPVEAVLHDGHVRRGRRVGQDRAPGPQGAAESVVGGLLLPPTPIELHEIADRAVGVLGVHQERQVDVQQPQRLRVRVLGVVPGHRDRTARVVVGAVAVAAIGDREPGVLKEPRVVGELGHVVQGRLGDLHAGDRLGGGQSDLAVDPEGQLDLAEQFPVGLPDLRPGPQPAVFVGLSSQGVIQRVVLAGWR